MPEHRPVILEFHRQGKQQCDIVNRRTKSAIDRDIYIYRVVQKVISILEIKFLNACFGRFLILLFVFIWYILYLRCLHCYIIIGLSWFVFSGLIWTWSIRRSIFATSCFSSSVVAEKLLMLSKTYVKHIVSVPFHKSRAKTGSRNFAPAIFDIKMSNVPTGR